PLERALSALCAGVQAEVVVGEPTEVQAGLANDKREGQVLNSMIAVGPKEVMIVASLPPRAVLSLVDLALGGTGKDCAMPSGKLPLSAQMMFGRFERMLADILVEAMALPEG